MLELKNLYFTVPESGNGESVYAISLMALISILKKENFMPLPARTAAEKQLWPN